MGDVKSGEDVQALHLEGVAQIVAGDPAAAAAVWRKVLERDPAYGPSLYNLAIFCATQGDVDQAEDLYKRAADASKRDARPAFNLGNLLLRQDRLEEAETWLSVAARRDQKNAQIQVNLAACLRKLGRLQEALKHAYKALKLDPANPEAHWNRGYILLLLDRYSEGLRELEWRFAIPGTTFKDPTCPLWNGGDVKAKTLLVAIEQGAGDMIQVARFFPRLAGLGARVVVECHPGLESLIAGADGVSEVVSIGGASDVKADCFVRALSLPFRLGVRFEDLPATNFPYLGASDPARNAARAALGPRDKALRVGLCWAGNPGFADDHVRSMALETLSPLASLSDLRFYSLQKGPASAEVAGASWPIVDLSAHMPDYEATAALMDELDVIVSVDTSVAHLAGALGKPCLMMIPARNDWRWGVGREEAPWYPGLRVLRQTTLGDWSQPIEAVLNKLSALTNEKAL